jgi:hypothetical protein
MKKNVVKNQPRKANDGIVGLAWWPMNLQCVRFFQKKTIFVCITVTAIVLTIDKSTEIDYLLGED